MQTINHSLTERISSALMIHRQPMTGPEIARFLNEPLTIINANLRKMRQTNSIRTASRPGRDVLCYQINLAGISSDTARKRLARQRSLGIYHGPITLKTENAA
ncbi:MAG TPA: hypothetical protein ENK35_03060 [Candidatus Tenderia sp.]|nr:hypothetical protein [Candidatus Tenderia sp.]